MVWPVYPVSLNPVWTEEREGRRGGEKKCKLEKSSGCPPHWSGGSPAECTHLRSLAGGEDVVSAINHSFTQDWVKVMEES